MRCLLVCALVLSVAACSKSEPPIPPELKDDSTAEAPAASTDRVKDADQLMAPAREGAQTLNAADKIDDLYQDQKTATDRSFEEQTK